MKLKLFAAITLLASLGLQSCVKDKCEVTVTYRKQTPVFKPKSEVLTMEVLPAQTIHDKGRIWLYGTYLLVNENKNGIHIFNNSNPSNPVALAFISIPGNTNMAVKNNVLLADNLTDLLSISLSDPAHPQLLKRTPGVFTNVETQGDQIVVDYNEEIVTETTERECGSGGGWFAQKEDIALTAGDGRDNAGGGAVDDGGGPNKGGSMARFTVVGDYLYIVDESSLIPVKVADPTSPQPFASLQLGWGDIETIFPAKGKLFIGSQSGMHICGLDNPAAPNYLAMFGHARSCDPVVVEGDYAYVTLRGGSMTECGGFTNQLDVINVKDVTNSRFVKSYPMTSPYGLGIENSKLFICDGSAGLKVYDATDPEAIDQNQIGHYAGVGTYDVIPYHNKLIMIADDGIRQYDYTDASNLQLLSTIPIIK